MFEINFPIYPHKQAVLLLQSKTEINDLPLPQIKCQHHPPMHCNVLKVQHMYIAPPVEKIQVLHLSANVF